MKNSKKNTKIICTIGPASNTKNTIVKMLDAGMNVARLNFSHGTQEDHQKVFNIIRSLEKKTGKPIAILADLQGPKIRIGKLQGGRLELKKGDTICLNNKADFVGQQDEIGCSYKGIIKDLKPGETFLVDDGKLTFKVIKKAGNKAYLKTIIGGVLKEHKGINLPGTKISSPALTKKDIADLEFARDMGVDYIALSFVREEKDVKLVKKHLENTFIGVIAKIERPEAIANIESIIHCADGIMIARGDLGIEIPPEKVPILQKKLIKLAGDAGKFAITATQMLESMINNSIPTRAEASDVANAVLDGTDAVMLSGESASGDYPVETVKIMTRIIMEAEILFEPPNIEPNKLFSNDDEIRLGTVAATIADSIQAKAIVNFTRSGYSANLASRFRPNTKIYSFTPFKITARKMCLMRGVVPELLPITTSFQKMLVSANNILKQKHRFRKKDKVLILSAAPGSKAYSVDFMQIYHIR